MVPQKTINLYFETDLMVPQKTINLYFETELMVPRKTINLYFETELIVPQKTINLYFETELMVPQNTIILIQVCSSYHGNSKFSSAIFSDQLYLSPWNNKPWMSHSSCFTNVYK